MKNYFIVSLIKNGILGGSMTADAEAITYRTGKVTVPAEFRRLVMKYSDIRQVETGRMLLMPTVTVKMQNGAEYKFPCSSVRSACWRSSGKRAYRCKKIPSAHDMQRVVFYFSQSMGRSTNCSSSLYQ